MARKELSPMTRTLTRLLVAILVGETAAEIGAHYFLDYIKSQSGSESLASNGPKGVQNLKIKQGVCGGEYHEMFETDCLPRNQRHCLGNDLGATPRFNSLELTGRFGPPRCQQGTHSGAKRPRDCR